MIVSYNWLKDLVKLNVSPEKLSADMSLYSVEVETFNKMVNATSLVVGHVLEVKMHENSDHLHVCQVDLGDKVSQIVCGAPNIVAGQKVIVALPGAVLPGGTIKPSKVRGVESLGMICSLQELGIENKYVPTKYQNGIYVLGDDAKVGSSALEYLCFDDYLIELGLTPNRMDLMSIIGVAHDVSAMYNLPLLLPAYTLSESEKEATSEISVELKTADCLSYYARVVENVKIKESPIFIKARLIASGIRPINNVVDITNYVLMLFGQPLHAFDKDKLGKKIIVRNATDDEKLVTLDNIERNLKNTDIVISDEKENNRAICLAGVMGGLSTEVTSSTTNLVLESAVFNPLTIRKTSARVGLRSESSVRYERGVDLNSSLEAVNYACYLLEKYADATVLKGYAHAGISHIDDTKITITTDYVYKYLGIMISKEEIEHICVSLGFKVEYDNENINVYVPNRRMDVKIKPDLIEEIARIHGYDRLNDTLPLMNVESVVTYPQHVRKVINKTLVGLGLNEVITYSLVSPKLSEMFKILYTDSSKPITLLHPMTEEHSILRRSLVPSLMEVLKYNNARKIYNLGIYEIGKVYCLENDLPKETWNLAGAIQGTQNHLFWKNSYDDVDFFYVKGILEQLFIRLGIKVKYEKLDIVTPDLHPGRSAKIIYDSKIIGYIGEIHPQVSKDNDIENTYVFELQLEPIYELKNEVVTFKPISKVPSVERDLALVMDKNQAVGDVIESIYRCDSKMIKNVQVFDLYEGSHIEEDKKSVAVRITLESDETLTDDIINAKIKKILNTLAYCYKIELRK